MGAGLGVGSIISLAAGGLAGAGAMLQEAHSNKWDYVDKKTIGSSSYGSPGIAGRMSGVSAGFDTKTVKYQERVKNKHHQTMERLGKAMSVIGLQGGTAANIAAQAKAKAEAEGMYRVDGKLVKDLTDVSKQRPAGPIQTESNYPSTMNYMNPVMPVFGAGVGTQNNSGESMTVQQEIMGAYDPNFGKAKCGVYSPKKKMETGGYSGGGVGKKTISSIEPITGASHAQGGVDTKVRGKAVEAEGGEYKVKFKDGSEAILNQQQMQALKDGVPIEKILQSMPKI